MNRIFLNIGILLSALAVTVSCGSDEAEQDVPVQPDKPDVEEKMQANVLTKAASSVVSTGVDVGMYMQHYVDGKMVDLYAAHNYVNNVRMKYAADGWKSAEPVYWYDESSLSDIYAYAPYQSDVEDCRNMAVGVPTDQTSTEQLAAADLLWGRNLALNPTTSQISVSLNHLFAKVNVKITPEADFAEGELKASDLKVFINNVRCEGKLDLQTGDVTLSGDPQTVCARNNGDLSFTVIVMPQTLGFVNLIRVEWGDVVYVLQRSIAFDSHRSYDLTVSINKKEATGLNIGISGWDIDDKDYGGVVE